MENPIVKSRHGHLAAQNPVLAGLLARNSRKPSYITKIKASVIASRLPNECLPKNLEKRLMRTPYTREIVRGRNSARVSQNDFRQVQIYEHVLLSAVQEEVALDSRGKVLMISQKCNASDYNQATNYIKGGISTDNYHQNVHLSNYGNLIQHNCRQGASSQNECNLQVDELAETMAEMRTK
ncbi:nuclear receptor coactivator 2 [Nephila pilipes]|uniref:Nuclear receptor coactivator 2 n=1 Tax=Nephila pilipes TaxID=299642 RepID=A0A8X6UL58_NEPPI|nr:nuclear receptor coactivator 2 [Nephila pilipes]